MTFESLEDRRVLATVSVSNLNDHINGNVSSIAALIATPGSDGISLREAIVAAQTDTATDTITFSVTGEINLTNTGHDGELFIDKALNIQGPGAHLLTIKAFDPDLNVKEGNGERIFDVRASSNGPPPVQISGLTLAGADVGQLLRTVPMAAQYSPPACSR